MSREATNLLSIGLNIYNCLICLFMIIYLCFSVKRDKSAGFLLCSIICVFLFNIADSASWCAEGLDKAWKPIYLQIGTFFYYFLCPCIFEFFFKYIEIYTEPKKTNPWIFRSTIILTGLYLIGLFISPFYDFYYYISPDNVYHRGQYNFISTFFYMCYFIFGIVFVLVNKKNISPRAFFSFISFSIFPIVTQILQMKFYGLSLVNVGMTISILLIFMNMHMNLEQSYKDSKIKAKQQKKQILNMEQRLIFGLSNLVENRDADTGDHVQRTSFYVSVLSQKLLDENIYPEIMDKEYASIMVKAAPFHDIGKISVSDTILNKPGKLNADEFEKMKIHAEKGAQIIQDILGEHDDSLYLQVATEMANFHHERWDGTGYPNQLKEQEIPLCARIMAIADVYDALVSKRCYKEKMTPEEALEIIKSESGTHFDPVLVKAFIDSKDSILVGALDYK